MCSGQSWDAEMEWSPVNSNQMFRSGTCALLGLLLLISLTGCSRKPEGQLDVYQVTGRVTIAGKPAQGVVVVLYPQAGSAAETKKLNPSGHTDENGEYVLTTYTQDDGVPEGTYRVALRWMETPAPSAKGLPPGFLPPVDKLKGRYADPAKTKWEIVVSSQTNELPVIEVPGP